MILPHLGMTMLTPMYIFKCKGHGYFHLYTHCLDSHWVYSSSLIELCIIPLSMLMSVLHLPLCPLLGGHILYGLSLSLFNGVSFVFEFHCCTSFAPPPPKIVVTSWEWMERSRLINTDLHQLHAVKLFDCIKDWQGNPISCVLKCFKRKISWAKSGILAWQSTELFRSVTHSTNVIASAKNIQSPRL